MQNRWHVELSRLAGLFDEALADPTPLNLFNAVHNFVCAPGAVLAPFFSDIHHKDSGLDLADSVVASALRKVLKGQERKAMRHLCSNGVAKVTTETIAELEHLHPQRTYELKLPTTGSPQVQVSHNDVADALFLAAGRFQPCQRRLWVGTVAFLLVQGG